MRRKAFLAGSLLAAFVLALVPLAARAQTLPGAAPQMAEIGDLLQRGQQLETERRWADALSHYEEAIRQFPDDRLLERRFEFARLHYDLGRRYHDQTFCDAVQRLSASEALDLYGDVLLKIHAHYVEAPNWKELVERGINSLEVALGEPAFLERNLPTANLTAVEDFRRELRSQLAARPIASRSDARDVAFLAGQLAQARLALPPTPVVFEFTCGATSALDPYSAYLTAGQLSDVYSQIDGNFVGLGVELKPNNGSLLIVRVIPNSPAQRGGIRTGDNIIEVNGQLTRNYPTDQAANLLQGEVGTVVELSVTSPGQEPRRVRIQRERIEVSSIDDTRMLDSAQGIGYLKLVCFQKNTSHELDAALWQLHREGMRSLIIDLRGNPGGLLVSAVEVADKFLERGTIVTTRGRSAQEDFIYSAHEEGTWRVPLVLLIDQDSASAAEILAGAIRDHHRGTIVGVRSYGKGSVQGIFPLGLAGAGVRLTTARFYSPGGRPYSRVGVEPDVAVHRTARPLANDASVPSDDTTLTAAVQVAVRSNRAP